MPLSGSSPSMLLINVTSRGAIRDHIHQKRKSINRWLITLQIPRADPKRVEKVGHNGWLGQDRVEESRQIKRY